MARFKFPSARVPRFLCETAFVGSHDARIAACCSLADLFDTADVERGAPPSSLLEGPGAQTRPSILRASSGGTRMLTTLGVPPPSCLIASPSLSSSVSSSSVLKAAIMLDQQLTTAFQTGLRQSLDDSVMTPCPICRKNEVGSPSSLDESLVAAEMNSFAASAHVSSVSLSCEFFFFFSNRLPDCSHQHSLVSSMRQPAANGDGGCGPWHKFVSRLLLA